MPPPKTARTARTTTAMGRPTAPTAIAPRGLPACPRRLSVGPGSSPCTRASPRKSPRARPRSRRRPLQGQRGAQRAEPHVQRLLLRRSYGRGLQPIGQDQLLRRTLWSNGGHDDPARSADQGRRDLLRTLGLQGGQTCPGGPCHTSGLRRQSHRHGRLVHASRRTSEPAAHGLDVDGQRMHRRANRRWLQRGRGLPADLGAAVPRRASAFTRSATTAAPRAASSRTNTCFTRTSPTRAPAPRALAARRRGALAR